jgi:thiosulfate dehydrogenase
MSLRHLTSSLVLLAACSDASRPVPAPRIAARTAAQGASPSDLLPNVHPFADADIPAGPLGVSVRRGLALVEHTRDSLPAYALSSLNCTSCHLSRGLRSDAAPLAGAHLRYPRFMDRVGAVVPVEDRINYCFTRSLAGRAIPPRSREMVDIVAYLAFVSRDVPGGRVRGEGLPKMATLASDAERGRGLYAATCARCHGANGDGAGLIPALWGERSYSVGASMARVERAASFVRHNMPYDRPGTLSDQQAWDISAYVNSHARPDLPGKEQDWPAGDAPADVPYPTTHHVPPHPVPLLPRGARGDPLVAPPVRAVRAGQR